MLAIRYRHHCRVTSSDGSRACSYAGVEVVDHPTQRDGAAWVTRPECVESGAQLVEVVRWLA